MGIMCNSLIATLFAIFIVFPLSSSARTLHGNDGGFCTSKGYLAYDDLEFREGGGEEPAASFLSTVAHCF